MENFFAKNLRFLRENKNMSQEDLAKKLGVEFATISHWENKRREPKMDMVVKIASVFNIDEDILFSDLTENNSLDKNLQSDYAILFDKISELSDADRELIINIIETRKKQIDKELENQ